MRRARRVRASEDSATWVVVGLLVTAQSLRSMRDTSDRTGDLLSRRSWGPTIWLV